MAPENTGEIQDGRFKPGESGNPAGRPRGARNKTTLAVQTLLDGEAEGITRKVIELARNGDMMAIRLVLDRILPPRKDVAVTIDLPPIESISDVVKAQKTLLQAVGQGEITPMEGEAIARLLEGYIKAVETLDLERRIDTLEKGSRP